MSFINEKIISNNIDNTAALVEVQKMFPLIEIARDLGGIIIGGIKLPYPTALSDIYCTLIDIQDAILAEESDISSLQ